MFDLLLKHQLWPTSLGQKSYVGRATHGPPLVMSEWKRGALKMRQARRGRRSMTAKRQVAKKRKRRIYHKRDDTKGYETLRHSNGAICSRLSQQSKKSPPFSPASHNKPILITPERGQEEGARLKVGKGNSPKVNQTQEFLNLGPCLGPWGNRGGHLQSEWQ